jgi:hypothetical protein
LYICNELRLIYLAQPRTASRSVSSYLKEHYAVRNHTGHHHLDVRECEWRRADGWQIVTTVRNHFDILVSWWHHNPRWFRPRDPNPTFEVFVWEFARHIRNKFVAPGRMYWKYQPFATEILKFETLWDDLGRVLGTEIPSEERPHIGPSTRKPYREYYDEPLRRFVEEEWHQEMADYGYEF